jgi:hypothetical protein
MNHDNINPFIGACVDPGHVCLLMMYAPKGSLQVCHLTPRLIGWC